MKLGQLLKSFLQRILIPFHWLFVRLPKPFSIPLLVVALIYFFVVFPALDDGTTYLRISLGKMLYEFGKSEVPWWVFGPGVFFFAVLGFILSLATTLFFAILGIVVSHGIAGKFYQIYRRRQTKPAGRIVPVYPTNGNGHNQSDNPLASFQKIGIILSGGGAKGAYQAGAMRAIYEFLEEHGAHNKVQMIAATSIGAWNALFWLSGLIKSSDDGPGPLEQWWREVNVQNIILPIWYIPTRQNYLLSNQPWQDNFDAIFRGTPAGERLLYHARNPFAEDATRFYFTHSNIEKAHLAFTTNRESWDNVSPNLPNRRSRPLIPPGTYRSVNDPTDPLRTLDNIRTGVFSSMDIPPLFPYTSIDKEFFEDGGVIDNLPIRFGTEIEECDLLFILPLNATFERTVDQKSLIRRLARVTEIRQGVLERNSFKMIYLYNELASLRLQVDDLKKDLKKFQPTPSQQTAPSDRDLTVAKVAGRALARTHKIVRVFSVCPAPELKIGTTEFWKTKEAGETFNFMYEATRNELKRFTSIVNSNQIRMALIAPASELDGNGEDPRFSIKDLPSNQVIEQTDVDGEKLIPKETDNKVEYRVTYFKDF